MNFVKIRAIIYWVMGILEKGATNEEDMSCLISPPVMYESAYPKSLKLPKAQSVDEMEINLLIFLELS